MALQMSGLGETEKEGRWGQGSEEKRADQRKNSRKL